MRKVVENKIRKLPRILETELMTVLKTRKEDEIVSLRKDIIEKNTHYTRILLEFHKLAYTSKSMCIPGEQV